MKKVLPFILLLALCYTGGVKATALSGSYTINASASASATNFKDFMSAVTYMTTSGSRPDGGPTNSSPFGVSGAVTFTVAAGTYSEQVVIPAITGASSTNTITFDGGTGNATTRTIQYAFGNTASYAVLTLNGADYIRLYNLTIKSTNANYGWGILVYNAADYNIVDNCIIDLGAVTSTSYTPVGICFSANTQYYYYTGNHGNYNVFQNNQIKGSASGGAYFGICLYGGTSGSNNYNQFINNSITDFYVYGMYIYYYTTGTVIKGNTLSRPSRTPTTFYGIYTYQYNQNMTIDGNKITNPCGGQAGANITFYGIQVYYNYNYIGNVIKNNLIYNINSNGYNYGIYSYYNYGIDIYNNTVLFDYTGTCYYNYPMYIYSGGSTSYTINMKNNILVDKQPNSSVGYLNYVGDNYSIYSFNNNVYLRTGNSPTSKFGSFNGSVANDFTEWKNMNGGMEANSWNADPGFSSSTNPLPTSCVIDNKGVYNASVATDITGATRNNPPDPGAYEFNTGGGATNAGISSITSPTMTTSACGASPSVTVVLKNYGTTTLTSAQINWKINGTAQTANSWTGSMAPGATATVTLGTLSTTPATQYNLVIYPTLPNGGADGCNLDDTSYSSYYYIGTPSAPSFSSSPYNICGVGPVKVSTQSATATTTLWYPNSSSNVVLNVGDTFTTPALYNSTSYYASKAITGAPSTVGSMAQYTYYGSNYNSMWDISATGGSAIIIDSITFNYVPYYSTTNDIKLYYKQGAFAGYQTNAAAWALAKNYSNIATPVSPAVHTIPTGGLVIPSGGTFGFFLYISGSCAWINSQSPSVTVTGDGISLLRGDIIQGEFATLYYQNSPYQPAMKVYYRKMCESGRQQVNVNVNYKPYGANVVPDTKFQGSNNGGNSYAPDIVGSKDTVVYKLTPPTGFANAGFGSTWIISSLKFTTINGIAPAAGDTMTTFPNASANGTIRFIPSKSYEDSTMVLRLTIKNLSTGCDSLIIKYIYVAPKPVANFSVTSLCFGTDTKFKDSTSLTAGVLSYEWEFGDPANTKSTEQFPTFMFPAAGTYNVKFKATSHLGYSNTILKSITILYTPVSAFSYTNVCKGKTTSFTNTSTVGGGNSMSYQWDLGNGSSSIATNPTFTYANAGSYNVKLTALSGTCTNSRTTTIYVFPVPTASYTGGLACSGLSIPFSNTSTIATGHLGYKWNFGDGSAISTEGSPVHSYDVASTYSVKLVTYSEFGCNDSVTKTITISAKPSALFTAPNACIGNMVNFANGSSVAGGGTFTSQWNFGDGVSQTNNNATFTHSYFNVGKYNAWLVTTTTQGCKDSVKKEIEVGAMPTVNFGMNGSSCAGIAMNFTDMSISSGALSYDWDFASAGSSTQQNPSFSFATAGNYNVKLTITSTANCVNTLTKQAIVNANPSAGFHVVKTNAQMREVSLIPTDPNLATYLWDMGDGQTFSQVSPVYRYLTNGPFTVKLTTTSQFGCTSTLSKADSASFNVSVMNINGTATSWSVYPNPFANSAKVECMLKSESDVRISLADATGRIVSVLVSGKLLSGTHYFDIDAAGRLAKGTYWVIFEQDGSRQTTPVIKY